MPGPWHFETLTTRRELARWTARREMLLESLASCPPCCRSVSGSILGPKHASRPATRGQLALRNCQASDAHPDASQLICSGMDRLRSA